MKNFLAVDTSGSYMSVLAVKDGKAFSVFEEDCAMKHSVLLMEKIDEALEKAEMTLNDCDFFAACVGAGSFTGIRIGISAVKGLALALKKPTVGVTSFAVAAYNAIDGKPQGKILCLVDALHDSYYACGYENGEVVLPPAYLPEERVLELCKEGYVLRSCAKLPIAEKTAVEVVSPLLGLENAALLAARRGEFGELSAVYVRKSSAEENVCK